MLDDQIVVVTGMPRTGTSMMMSMIHATGVPIVADGHRAADEDNPRGYFEDARAKSLHRDHAWIGSVRGHAIKVVLNLVPMLPAAEKYMVIVMHRNLVEVTQSQALMLSRQGGTMTMPEAQLQAVYAREYQRVESWLDSQDNVSWIAMDYAAVLNDTTTEVMRIAAFLGMAGMAARMAAEVDASLWHHRSE